MWLSYCLVGGEAEAASASVQASQGRAVNELPRMHEKEMGKTERPRREEGEGGRSRVKEFQPMWLSDSACFLLQPALKASAGTYQEGPLP